jgi:hypothetical protein
MQKLFSQWWVRSHLGKIIRSYVETFLFRENIQTLIYQHHYGIGDGDGYVEPPDN